MKIIQEPKFQPITIILESKEEAKALCKALRFIDATVADINEEDLKIIYALSNWFYINASL